jgi:predicted RNase H-like HicB family nuclease
MCREAGKGLVAEMSTYTARVERGEQYWLVTVPEIARTTQARTLREVEPMARDLIAVMEQVDPQSFELKADIVFPPVAYEHWTRATLLREQAAQAQAEAAEAARTAALTLAELGLTMRDVGAVLGVSHQRAAQLITEAAEAARTPVEALLPSDRATA